MTTHYRKVGRKYVPVSDTEAWEGLDNGAWLVVVDNGRRCARALLDTRRHSANLLAALADLEDQLATAIVEASRTDTPRLLTKREQRAWRAWVDALGEERPITVSRPSAVDIARRAVQAIQDKLAECTEVREVPAMQINGLDPLEWLHRYWRQDTRRPKWLCWRRGYVWPPR